MSLTVPNSSLLTDDSKQALHTEQLRLIFDTQYFNLIATLAITAVVAATLTPVTDQSRVAEWCVFMLVCSAVRMAIFMGWHRDPKRHQHPDKWRKYLFISSLIGGLGWGVGNFILFPEQSPENQMLLVFITAGISSAAAISLAPDPPIAWSFLLPCILPMELQIFMRPNSIGFSLGVLGLVYMGFLSAVIIRLHKYVKENVALRIAEREREQLQNEFSQALRSSQEKLQVLNTRLSLATQAGGIGVWELDLTNNSLLWDERMYEIYGVEPGAKSNLGEVAASLVHPDDWAEIRSSLIAAINDPHSERHVLEFRLVMSDDNERWIRTAGLIQRDEKNIARRVIGVAWDITELKHVARMKSEFVSSVSHELRTPLTSIRGSLGLLVSGVTGELPEAAKELVDMAYKNCERLSLLINDILDIEKIESGKMRLDVQHHQLRPLIEQAVEANQGYAHHLSVHLLAQVDTENAIVVDADRFMQVMANLISNAVKFSKPGDSVEIAAVDVPERVRIEVRDRGPGVPMEFRERIFQRFSQADSSDTRMRGGSGLGLAITKTLLEKMHGEIGFIDRAGGGTVFFIELPTHNKDIYHHHLRGEAG